MLTSYIKNYNFNSSNPIGLIPWNLDFLDELENLIQGLGEKFFNIHKKNQDFICNKQDIILVFPHNRPKRYLENRYKKLAKKINKPITLPTILTENQFTTLCLGHWERGQIPYQDLQTLDRIAILYQTVINIAKTLPKSAVLRRLVEDEQENFEAGSLFDSTNMEESSLSLAKFFPYAFNLDRIFEECFNQLVEVVDIAHAEGEVSDLAAALLSILKTINQTYTDYLTANTPIDSQCIENSSKLSTPAFANYRAAKFVKAFENYGQGLNIDTEDNLNILGIEHLNSAQKDEFFANFMPPIFRNRIIIFAGFVRLTASQNQVFKYFWQNGACFVWHSDSALCRQNDKVHYACADHKNWLKAWKTSCNLLNYREKIPAKFHFLAGYDNHSQIQVLMEDLKICHEKLNKANPNDTLSDDDLAILLPKPSLLMPVLHDLPEKNVNISMGYPVGRTLLTQFIEIIVSLQLQKQKNDWKKQDESVKNYYWHNLLALFRHPYTKLLSLPRQDMEHEDFTEFSEEWRSLLFFLENKLKTGYAQLNLEEFLDASLGDLDNHEFEQDILDFCETFIDHHIKNFESLNCLYDLGTSLEKLSTFLLKYAGKIWDNYPLDGEALVRLVEHVVPTLKENLFAKNILPSPAIFNIFKQLLSSERIPFEADPLSGMQILGMLETRLLHFKNLFILDFTEDNLPGKIEQDPLLPDSLRSLLGLPSSHNAETLIAHTLYRLLAGAEEVWLYWQEGILASSLQEKSVRSRFVEEIIWDMEQKFCKILSSSDGIIRKPEIHPMIFSKQNPKKIICTEKIRESLYQLMQTQLSSTMLDTYLSCPAKFFYTYLARLREEASVAEGDDNRELGFWFHIFLKEVYSEHLNQAYSHDKDNLQKVLAKFEAELEYSKVHQFVSPENYFILKQAGKFHLSHYFAEMQNEIITPLALEKEFSAEISEDIIFENRLKISKLHLKGIFDRVDQREIDGTKYHLILDYKTGKKQTLNQKLWDNPEFWGTVKAALANQDFSHLTFMSISQKIPSIQLPLYLYIYNKNNAINSNAAWVFLREKNKEVPLVKLKEANFDMLEQINDKLFPDLLSYLVNHLLNAKEFEACAGKACNYCPHINYCLA